MLGLSGPRAVHSSAEMAVPHALLKLFERPRFLPLLAALILSSAALAQQPAKPRPATPRKPHRERYEPKSLVDVTHARRVNVAQLEEALRESRGHSDRQVAKQLALLGLTQRFSLARLRRWQSLLPGKRSRRALALLADASTFLPLPNTDQLALPRPTVARQKQILNRAVDYLANDLRQLPNFFATLVTQQYQEADAEAQRAPDAPAWHHVLTHRETVLYRDGHEVIRARSHPSRALHGAARMYVQGTFGPVLVTVAGDAAHGTVEWSHWEQSKLGPMAVFRYRIAKTQSHYGLSFQAAANGFRGFVLRHQTVAYHGEIAVDPATGAILRLTIEADPDSSVPIVRSDVAIHYAPTVIGGNDYICPLRSVAIARGWSLATDAFGIAQGYGDEMTTLNQMTYTNYHVFRSTSRILSGNPPGGEPRR